MTRRRPGKLPSPSAAPRRPVADPPPADGSIGIWYAALIGAVLLIATGIYAAFLYQQGKEWRRAADQLTIGQELLRADRDEILEKAREREVTLSTLEAAREQDRARLEGVEDQRRRLQSDVLRLTQALAQSEEQANGANVDADSSVALERLQRERDRQDQETAEKRADTTRLETALAEKEQALAEHADSLEATKSENDAMRAEMVDLEVEKAGVQRDRERLERQLAERLESERRRQIIRGHRASLGEVRPYITELGPEDWSVIESWLALQLRRPMAVPDLVAHGWSYEGARLLGSIDGPPMAMLLYADAEERPTSLTIALDRNGERPLAAGVHGGLDLLDWREEHHAFLLAGEAGEEALEAVAIDLQNQPPRLSEDAPVPVSRYVRPSFRPALPP